MEEGKYLESSGDAKGKKKPRRRMKALFNSIKEQMEFYFSDANLHKDRFLKKAINSTSDGFIELSTFLKFNKIKAMTGDANVLADAISATSKFLQVNESKTHVKRTTPIEEPKNVDERTVYVECLPHSVNHEWVKKLFSSCGKVAYVSLPRYPSTGDLKGFAFVEFETIEDAQLACQELNNPPADSLSRVGMFPKSNSQIEDLKKKLPEEQIEETKEEAKELVLSENDQTNLPIPAETLDIAGVSTDPKPSRRRTASEGSVGESQGTPAKKRKPDVSFEDQKPSETDKGAAGAKKKSRKRKNRAKTIDSVSSGTAETSKTEDSELDTSGEVVVPEKKQKMDKPQSDPDTKSKENTTGEKPSAEPETVTKSSQESKKKKNRRRKKKARKEKEITELRVIPKTEWLGLREEYLRLQKASMTLLKQKLKDLEPKCMEEQPEAEEKPEKKKGRDIQFVPGVIVKVSSENPLSRKALKECVGEDVGVAYIDVKDGLQEGHIRCENSKAAQTVLEVASDNYTFSLVAGDAEKQYWDKLKADRETKFNSKSKHKKRGQQKLMDKAQKATVETVERKHITFDDD